MFGRLLLHDCIPVRVRTVNRTCSSTSRFWNPSIISSEPSSLFCLGDEPFFTIGTHCETSACSSAKIWAKFRCCRDSLCAEATYCFTNARTSKIQSSRVSDSNRTVGIPIPTPESPRSCRRRCFIFRSFLDRTANAKYSNKYEPVRKAPEATDTWKKVTYKRCRGCFV